MQRFALVFLCALLIPFVQQKAPVFPSGTIIDLSYPFDSETVYWLLRRPSNSRQILRVSLTKAITILRIAILPLSTAARTLTRRYILLKAETASIRFHLSN